MQFEVIFEANVINYQKIYFDFGYFGCIRFRSQAVKSVMQEVLNDELSGKYYDAEETTNWTKSISEQIKEKVKGKTSVIFLQYVIIISYYCVLL